MQQNIEFERCIDFLVRMIDKYGEEVLRELEEEQWLGTFRIQPFVYRVLL